MFERFGIVWIAAARQFGQIIRSSHFSESKASWLQMRIPLYSQEVALDLKLHMFHLQSEAMFDYLLGSGSQIVGEELIGSGLRSSGWFSS